MHGWRRRFVTALLRLATVSLLLATALLLVALAGWLTRFNDSVTLPNGMILRREIDLKKTERDDLFASDGRRVLARDIEFVCFNDRYVRIGSYEPRYGGLYDAATDRKVPTEEFDQVYTASGLMGGNGCNTNLH